MTRWGVEMHAFSLVYLLASEITVKVENRAEWILYNDIFVEGEYDLAIRSTLERERRDRPLTIVDLGANVGYFTLRMFDQMRRFPERHTMLEIFLIEASATLCDTLHHRLSEMPSIYSDCLVINGLVGQKSGTGRLYECAFHANNSTFVSNAIGQVNVRHVDYVDLATMLSDVVTIDLLKCDIEGSEGTFVKHNLDLLCKTRAVIMELHPKLCDVTGCFQHMADAGLKHYQLLHESKRTSNPTYYFWR